MVTLKTMASASSEARRFLMALRECEIRFAKLSMKPTEALITGMRESAALKRASLDLTRALADLRRPRP